MAENIRHKRHALRKAMKNVIPLKPPLDCAKLADRLREILLGDPSDAERVAFERALFGLRVGQRAMIAARAAEANCLARKSAAVLPTSEGKKVAKLSIPRCAEFVQVSFSIAREARLVLKRGTAAEIRAIEEGGYGNGIGVIVDQLRQNLTSPQRKRLAEIPFGERGDGPGRVQSQRVKASIWRQLRAALEAAATLPRIVDVVDIARTHDRTGFVDRYLLSAHERLGELIEVWTRPSQNEG